jgi:ring-1,2-phenylacetyl-CoA epoxidase subunit PaaC
VNRTAIDIELATYMLRLADDNMVIGQRLGEYLTRAPELEEDLAVGNLALDHIGVAQHLYDYAAEAEGKGRSADELAMLRSEREYSNCLLVEQPNGDFANVMARQFLFDAYQLLLWGALAASHDPRLGGIASQAEKEARYHLRHSSGWVIKLGDGTAESHQRMQQGIDTLWRFTAEPFEIDELEAGLAADGVATDASVLRDEWETKVDRVLGEATLRRPEDPYQASGGRSGMHTEHLGHLLAEMQWMQRSYPGLEW